VEGSLSAQALQTTAQASGVSVQVLSFPTVEVAIDQLTAGQVAAVAADRALLLGPAYATPGLTVLPWRLSEVPLALGLPAGDSAFRDLVNLTLQAMRYDGQFVGLYTAWFDDTPPAHTDWPGVPYRALSLDVGASGGG
jgi:ABC-type amino acid transport substrate-binding protein